MTAGRRLLFAILLVSLALVACVWAISEILGDHAEDKSLIAEVSYLRDDRNLDIADVEDLPFRQVTATFTGGYDTAAHWFRVRLSPSRDDGPIILTVGPAYLDHVSVFVPQARNAWAVQHSGDLVPLRDRPVKSAGLGFLLPAGGDDVYFIRVRTESTVQVFLAARSQRNELIYQGERMALHAALLTLMGVSVVIAFIQSLVRNTLTHALLTANSLSYLVFATLMLGYGAVAYPEWDVRAIAATGDAMYFVATASSLGFHRHFLSRMRAGAITVQFADALTVSSVMAFLLYLAGFETAAFQANSIIVLASVVALVGMAFTARTSADPPLPLVRFIYAVHGSAVFGWMVVVLGVAPASSFHRYSIEVHGFLNVMLVLSLLLSRWWFVENRQLLARVRLQDVTLRAEAAERAADLQDKLLNMLVHEVRNQLATVRLFVEHGWDRSPREEALATVDQLEQTITDCVRLGWLERQEWRPAAGSADLCTVVMEALSEAGEDDRIEIAMPEDTYVALDSDGAMLRIAVTRLVQVVALGSEAGARIDVTLERTAWAPVERWRLVIGATCADQLPLGLEPYAPRASGEDSPVPWANLAVAVAQGIVGALSGELSLGYKERRFECTLSLAARSTSA